MTECWCVKYHTYQLGTKKLTLCEHECHANEPEWHEREGVHVRSDDREISRGIAQYVDPFETRERERRARANLERRGFVFPASPTYLRTYPIVFSELYIDEYPERWIEGYE